MQIRILCLSLKLAIYGSNCGKFHGDRPNFEQCVAILVHKKSIGWLCSVKQTSWKYYVLVRSITPSISLRWMEVSVNFSFFFFILPASHIFTWQNLPINWICCPKKPMPHLVLGALWWAPHAACYGLVMLIHPFPQLLRGVFTISHNSH